MSFERVEIGNAILYRGDCMDVLASLGANSAEVVITDPPYMNLKGNTSITFDSGVSMRETKSQTVGDPWLAHLDWLPEAWRVSKYGLLAFCSYHFVAELRAKMEADPVALVTWYQRNAMPSACNAPHFQTEFVWAFKKTPGLKWKNLKTFIDVPRLQAGCMAVERIVDRQGKAVHQCQKPVRVMQELMLIGGESVLDPFMGTGSTGVAAIGMQRRFIGIERDPKYFDIACKRIEQAQAQLRLFA